MKVKSIKIGDRLIGPNQPAFIVAEIGINHNGDINLAKQLISAAKVATCDAVKFQKRTIDIVYNPEELEKPRENPFGPTNGDLKRGLEFDYDAYMEIDKFCKSLCIMWFSSCWDEGSVDFMEGFNPPCYKIASACLTNDSLLQYHKSKGRPILLSTGMSTLEQVDHAVELLGRENLIIMQCTSTYPAKVEELNLKVISFLAERYNVPVGYSGHEVGLYTTLAATVLGACVVERHITLDRAMWGSDHAASVEPHGIMRLAKDIRGTEKAMGDGVKRIYDSEIPVMHKLRRVEG